MDKCKSVNIETILIRIYLLIIILEAPLRYILNLVNLAVLIYVKDIIIVTLFFIYIKNNKMNKNYIIGMSLLLIPLIVSFIYIHNIKQIMFFILKIVMIFIVGCMEYKNIINDIKTSKKYYYICYTIIIIGVLLNTFITFPWENLNYSIGKYDINATRYWTTNGIKRIAGFSRASFNVATQICIFSLITKIKTKKMSLKIINLCISVIAIYITTTKGVLISYIIVNLIDFGYMYKKNIHKIIITIIAILMIILPIFSIISEPIFNYLKDNINSDIYIRYFASFEARIKNTWPEAFKMVKEDGNIVFGKGLGGVGVAESIYSDSYTPADNLFVYLYSVIGIFSFLFIGWIILKMYKLEYLKLDEKFIIYILFIIFSYGIVTNILEEPILCIYFGVCIGYIINNKGPKQIKWRKNENISS